MSQTVSANSSGRSSSRQRQKIRTLPADALEAMPAGRAILRAAKCPPALIETMPWYTGSFAGAVADARVRAGQAPPYISASTTLMRRTRHRCSRPRPSVLAGCRGRPQWSSRERRVRPGRRPERLLARPCATRRRRPGRAAGQ